MTKNFVLTIPKLGGEWEVVGFHSIERCYNRINSKFKQLYFTKYMVVIVIIDTIYWAIGTLNIECLKIFLIQNLYFYLTFPSIISTE